MSIKILLIMCINVIYKKMIAKKNNREGKLTIDYCQYGFHYAGRREHLTEINRGIYL